MIKIYLYYYYFSFPFLMISSFLIILSYSPIFMWMIMEFNLICFINILSIYKFSFSQILMNYFLINTFNSYLFIYSSLMMNFNVMNYLFNLFIFLAMASKMGLPPFHTWYLNFMMNISWMTFFLNSTIQKFIPMFITFKFLEMKMFSIKIIIIIILFINPIMSMNSKSLKFIMSFSSIIQILWTMILMMYNEKLWITFFLIYSLISFSIIFMFKMFNFNYIHEIYLMKTKSNYIYMLNLMIFSLMNLPPFFGFINKFMFFNNMSSNSYYYFLMLITSMTLMNTFFYSRMMIFNLMFFNMSINKNFKNIYIMNNLNFKKFNLILIMNFLFIFMYELI
uniref:NADH-ubiquinone oxidoreductase chain 2 n=1 Tax=Platencyrtus parkeri TaxID=752748 RepID=A0A7G5WI19_9HYME|nr:NADH dehydrogenase subunit 2 [Platencyrtus parkeri]